MASIDTRGVKIRARKKKKNLKKALQRCPHRKGVCIKVLTRSPKKPNSAKRPVAKVRLTTRKEVYVHIPGEGHNLRVFSVILVRGGNVKDLPSVRYKAVRGVKDLGPVNKRMSARSKYGVKRPKARDTKKLLLGSRASHGKGTRG